MHDAAFPKLIAFNFQPTGQEVNIAGTAAQGI
jgi:hypothetical protein